MAQAKREFSSVDRLYDIVKDMAIRFKIKPGNRVNEVELAHALGASRTPLREALNRLVAEGFLTFQRGRGFFCREFHPREIFELYQLRQILETAAVRLACDLATQGELDKISDFLDTTGPDINGRSSEELVALDEQFHESIMSLARNEEMTKMLENVNARIKFFRWMDMESKRTQTQREHQQVIEALQDRDADRAATLIERHISRRLDQITEAVKEGNSRIQLIK